MKLIAGLKLQPSPQQYALLLRTLEVANAACNHVSDMGWQERVFGHFALHRLCYANVRAQFGLGADCAVRVFAKVADGYKLDKETKRTFKPHGAFPFNDRLVSYNLDKRIVSVWTMEGRQKMPFIVSEPCCGHVDTANRKTQGSFLCTQCGYSGLADYIAAVNIGRRALLSAPNVSDTEMIFHSVAPETSSPIHREVTDSMVR